MSEKLKPCPFCGTTEHLFVENREERGGDYISDHVVCGMCGAVHLKDDDLGWNNRPTEKAAREEVLKMVCKSICVGCDNGADVDTHEDEFIHVEQRENDDIYTFPCKANFIRQAYREWHEQG